MSRRIAKYAAPILLVFWPLLAFAQDNPNPAGVTDNLPQTSAFWTVFLTAVALPFLGAALKFGVEAAFAVWKTKNEKKASAWYEAWRVADAAIAEVDRKTAMTRSTIMRPDSPGGRKVTPEEARDYQRAALAAIKTWWGENGMEQVATQAGVARSAIEAWFAAIIEERFKLRKIAETAAEPAPTIAATTAPLRAAPLAEGAPASPR